MYIVDIDIIVNIGELLYRLAIAERQSGRVLVVDTSQSEQPERDSVWRTQQAWVQHWGCKARKTVRSWSRRTCFISLLADDGCGCSSPSVDIVSQHRKSIRSSLEPATHLVSLLAVPSVSHLSHFSLRWMWEAGGPKWDRCENTARCFSPFASSFSWLPLRFPNCNKGRRNQREPMHLQRFLSPHEHLVCWFPSSFVSLTNFRENDLIVLWEVPHILRSFFWTMYGPFEDHVGSLHDPSAEKF